jgi:hypothetical protein
MLNRPDLHRPVRRPLRVALLCSHRAPGLLYLLNHCPDRGVTYEIVCCLTSERTFAEESRIERREMRATVHLVDEVPDGGAPIVRSWAFPVSPLVEEQRSLEAPDIVRVDNGLRAACWLLDSQHALRAPEVELATH